MTLRRHALFSCLLPPASCLLLLAAAPPTPASPDDLTRQANAVFADDPDEAGRLYTAAEERTTDPGLVAFNLAAVHFRRGEYRDAEAHYTRVIDDAACPPERAAKAWYNRGTSLLRRGGSAAVYRSAIACLERSLDSPAADEPLKAAARHNLELAKVLWNEARKTAPKPENPNAAPPPEDPRNDQPPPNASGTDTQPGTPEAADGATGGTTRPILQPQPTPVGGVQPGGAQQSPAQGNTPNLQPLQDTDQVQPLSPEDTREYLRRAAEKFKKDRQTLLRTLYGADRPGVRDW